MVLTGCQALSSVVPPGPVCARFATHTPIHPPPAAGQTSTLHPPIHPSSHLIVALAEVRMRNIVAVHIFSLPLK